MANTWEILERIVETAKCKVGWGFRIDDDEEEGYRLVIRVAGYDSAHPSKLLSKTIDHFFPVPFATYNEKTWKRWVFECCRLVENHELGEWFRIGDERPFQPLHGPGENPYMIHEFRDMTDALTTQNGTLREPYT